MAASFKDGAVFGLCLMAMVVVGSIGAEAQLYTDFYDDSCPEIYDIVKAEIRKAVAAEARIAASLIRLHFHDCFVNGSHMQFPVFKFPESLTFPGDHPSVYTPGKVRLTGNLNTGTAYETPELYKRTVRGCDGSILLNSTDTDESEQFSFANNNTIRGFPVINSIKAKLEDACPQTVSCADIVAIAYRDSAVEVGLTPEYPVFFGRRDSLTFSQADANRFLPAPFFDYPTLKQSFENVTLDEVDLVALSGAHTIGRVHCNTVLGFVKDTTSGFNPIFQQFNNKTCFGPNNQSTLANLDLTTPDKFDNSYYKNLLVGEGIIKSDQVLWSTPGGINQALVAEFAVNPVAFGKQFGISSIKMGNLNPLTGDDGEIRLNCAVVNDASSSSSGSAASLVASQ